MMRRRYDEKRIEEKVEGWDSLLISAAMNGYLVSDGSDHDCHVDISEGVVCRNIDELQTLVSTWAVGRRPEREEDTDEETED